MNVVYLIVVVFIVRTFIYYRKSKNENVSENKVDYNCNKEVLYSDSKTPIENIKKLDKNKWLYPNDEFVKHKKLKRYKLQTYKF